MSEIDEKIDQLQSRLENLLKYQEYFQREISQMRYEINNLRAVQQKRQNIGQTPVEQPPKPNYVTQTVSPPEATSPPKQETQQTPLNETDYTPNFQSTNYQTAQPESKKKSDIENFIGENLASKIGILITVIGVVIGAKYAIDNNLISPLMRIVFGYVVGFGLLGFGVKLKQKYLNFSAVLVSGAMAIMYFVTFAAYNYYNLFSQSSAFVLMLIFTVFTVVAAINYNRQIIAHLGMVGAYSIPFLLSESSGRVDILFSYIAIINIGILAVSIKKYWKLIHYLSFAVTWIIFLGWYIDKYRSYEHFTLALTFATIFFLTFYLTFTAYKIITESELSFDNVLLILVNSFIFFGIGYGIIEDKYQGIFAVANAGVHFIFAAAVSRFRPLETNTVDFLSALMITFCTIAIPIQLEGNWITLLWISEAVLLFALGRMKQIPLYEYFAYPLMLLSFGSILKDWVSLYLEYFSKDSVLTPFLNPYFMTGMLFVIGFAVILYLNKNPKYPTLIERNLHLICSFGISAILLFVLYNTFRIEIGNYFQSQSFNTAIRDASNQYINQTNSDLDYFNVVWQINYTMFFLTVLSFANIRWFKNTVLAYANIVLNVLVMFVFLTVGLLVMSQLRESYLNPPLDINFAHSSFNIFIRYISYIFFIALLYANYQYFKQSFLGENVSESQLTLLSDFGIHFSAIWLLSSELLNWMDIFKFGDSFKLGLSILWGLYALFLVGLGINKHRKHLRIGAIVLFALTLVKLFFYDIAELGTISKTVVFVSLGILLLIISFLYTKYKHLIFDEVG